MSLTVQRSHRVLAAAELPEANVVKVAGGAVDVAADQAKLTEGTGDEDQHSAAPASSGTYVVPMGTASVMEKEYADADDKFCQQILN